MKLLRNQLNTITVILFIVIILILNISFGALSFRYSEELHRQYSDKIALVLDKKIQTAFGHADAIIELMNTDEYSMDFSNNLLLQPQEKQTRAINTIQRDLEMLNGPSSYISSIYVIGKDTNQFGFAYYTDNEKMDSFISQLDTNDLLNSGLISVIYREETVFVNETEINKATEDFFKKDNFSDKYKAVSRLKNEISNRLISCRYIDSRIVILVFDEEKMFGTDYAEYSELELKILSSNRDTVYSNTDISEDSLKYFDKIELEDYTVLFKNEKFSINYYYYAIPFACFILLLPLFVFLVNKVSHWIVFPINQITGELAADKSKKIVSENIGKFSLKDRIFIPLFSLLLAHYIMFCGIDFVCLSIINNTQNKQIIEIDKAIISENIVRDFYDPARIVPISLNEIEMMTANKDADSTPELYDLLKVGTTNGYELDLLIIIDENGGIIYRSKPFYSPNDDLMVKYALEKKEVSNKNQLLFYSDGSETQTAFWLKQIADVDGTKGYMIAVIDKESYSLLSKDIKWTDMFIADENGKTVYSSIQSIDTVKTGADGDVLQIGNEKYVVCNMKYGNLDWEIMYMLPVYIANRLLERFVNYILAVVFILLVIVYVAVTLFSYSLAKNVNSLIDCMISTEKFTNRLRYGENEINCLVDTYNQMLDRIGFLTEKLVKEEKRQENLRYLKAQSELTALKAQVNAHFIFNVLNIIHEDAVRNKNDIITGIVESLSSMIRYSMAPEMLTTVCEELESVNRYIYIQKIRYGSHFQFYYEIEDEIGKVKILRLIIQPLVENAIDHGLFNMNGGKVYLSVYRSADMLRICVTDDGIGMRKTQVEKMMEYIKATEEEAGKMNRDRRFGVALRNIYQRIKTYYGNSADMRFISDFMNGTTVELTVPLYKEEEMQND